MKHMQFLDSRNGRQTFPDIAMSTSRDYGIRYLRSILLLFILCLPSIAMHARPSGIVGRSHLMRHVTFKRQKLTVRFCKSPNIAHTASLHGLARAQAHHG